MATRKSLTKIEEKRFGELFSKYCQCEILNRRCDGNYSCENCPVAEAYRVIFAKDKVVQKIM